MAPPLGTWIANNTAPRARRATGLALFAMLANAGGVLATWLYGPLSPAPRYTAASGVLLAAQVAIIVCAGATRAWLARENGRKGRERERARAEGRDAVGTGREVRALDDLPNESAWFTYML